MREGGVGVLGAPRAGQSTPAGAPLQCLFSLLSKSDPWASASCSRAFTPSFSPWLRRLLRGRCGLCSQPGFQSGGARSPEPTSSNLPAVRAPVWPLPLDPGGPAAAERNESFQKGESPAAAILLSRGPAVGRAATMRGSGSPPALRPGAHAGRVGRLPAPALRLRPQGRTLAAPS